MSPQSFAERILQLEEQMTSLRELCRKVLEAVSVSVRVVDRSGRTVDRVDDIVPAERFSKAGAADYRFNLPLSILAPGPIC